MAKPIVGDLVTTASADDTWELDADGHPIIPLATWPLWVCPFCRSSDACQRVSALVAAGTSHSTTLGASHYGERSVYGSNTSGGGRGDQVGTLGGGWGQSISATTSMSGLASRFACPAPPRGPGGGLVLSVVVFLVTVIAVQVVVSLSEAHSGDGGSRVGLAILGTGVAAGWAANVWLRARRRNHGVFERLTAAHSAWSAGHKMMLEGYYCSRDDLVFGPGPDPTRLGWGTPEEWVSHCFAVAAPLSEESQNR